MVGGFLNLFVLQTESYFRSNLFVCFGFVLKLQILTVKTKRKVFLLNCFCCSLNIQTSSIVKGERCLMNKGRVPWGRFPIPHYKNGADVPFPLQIPEPAARALIFSMKALSSEYPRKRTTKRVRCCAHVCR